MNTTVALFDLVTLLTHSTFLKSPRWLTVLILAIRGQTKGSSERVLKTKACSLVGLKHQGFSASPVSSSRA